MGNELSVGIGLLSRLRRPVSPGEQPSGGAAVHTSLPCRCQGPSLAATALARTCSRSVTSFRVTRRFRRQHGRRERGAVLCRERIPSWDACRQPLAARAVRGRSTCRAVVAETAFCAQELSRARCSALRRGKRCERVLLSLQTRCSSLVQALLALPRQHVAQQRFAGSVPKCSARCGRTGPGWTSLGPRATGPRHRVPGQVA